MILPTISEEDFRKDKAAVDALTAFLSSPHGQLFAAAMRGGDPMNHLATPHNRQPQHLRDLAIAEGGHAENLLGVCKGYRVGMLLIDLLTQPIIHTEVKTSGSQHSRVTKALNQGPKD